MSEVPRVPDLRVGSELAIRFGEYLLGAADLFNGEPFITSGFWQVERKTKYESSGGSTEVIEFTAERNKPDTEDGEMDDQIEFYIGHELHRSTSKDEFTPSHNVEDVALVYEDWYSPERTERGLTIDEHTVVSVAEITRYTVGFGAHYLRKVVRFDYYDDDQDLVASLYPSKPGGKKVELHPDKSINDILQKHDNQLMYCFSSLEVIEITGVLERLGYTDAYKNLPEGLK